jgi:ethanolamine ammonia-lyase small subunit
MAKRTGQDLATLRAVARARTPARILVGRAGPAYRTATQLELREDLAAANDAVQVEVDLERDLGRAVLERWKLFEVGTQAGSKAEYLMRPDLGRSFAQATREEIVRGCAAGPDLQVVLGDGLSGAALVKQAPALLAGLEAGAAAHAWRFGQPFFVRHCRVGILNEVGELLDPAVVVLLIGERPGLSTATSLSAYMAFRPRPGHNDARRNLISNIHERGVAPDEAARRILALAEKMMREGTSGVSVKEELPAAEPPRSLSAGVGEGERRARRIDRRKG